MRLSIVKERAFGGGTRHFPILLLCFLALFFLGACKTVEDDAAAGRAAAAVQVPASGNTALLSIFFNLREPSVPALSMELADLEILIGDAWFPVLAGPVLVDTEAIRDGQVFLARLPVPVGPCQGMRFRVVAAAFNRGERTVPMEIAESVVEVSFPTEMGLESGDSKSIFMSWDVEASLKGRNQLTPVVLVVPQTIPLLTDLAFAACPDINTIYIIRTDRNWVYGSIGIRGRPTYLALDSSRERLYALAETEGSLKVIDLNMKRVIDSFRIPMLRKPGFMTISSDGLWAYVLDQSNHNLVRIDLSTGSTEARVRLNEQPQFLYYVAGQDRLAVSSPLASAVYLLNPLSLDVIEAVPAGSTAQGMAAWEDKLYIAERSSNRVMVYDLGDRLIEDQISAGFFPRRIQLSNGKLYIANHDSSSISVLRGGQANIFQEISLDSPPLEMTHSESRNWLYVGNGKVGGLTVIDTTVNKQAGLIDFRAIPLGLAATTD